MTRRAFSDADETLTARDRQMRAEGMTIREAAAIQIMAALCINNDPRKWGVSNSAAMVVEVADALIEALGK